MAGRWVSYDDAYSHIEQALAAAGGDVADTEYYIVAQLEMGKLKARAVKFAVYVDNFPRRVETNFDVSSDIWRDWISCDRDKKNGGPDFSFWGIATRPRSPDLFIRAVLSGSMIESYGLIDILNQLSPVNTPPATAVATETPPEALGPADPVITRSKRRPGVQPLADWEAIGQTVMDELERSFDRTQPLSVKRVAGEVRDALRAAGNTATISDLTIANRAKEIRTAFLGIEVSA